MIKIDQSFGILFVLKLFLSIILLGSSCSITVGLFLRKELSFDFYSEQDALIQVFLDHGHGFNEVESVKVPHSASSDLKRIHFKLEESVPNNIRFDPSFESGHSIKVGHFSIVDGWGNVLSKCELKDSYQLNHVSNVLFDEDSRLLSFVTKTGDAQLYLHQWKGLDLRSNKLMLIGGLCLNVIFAGGLIYLLFRYFSLSVYDRIFNFVISKANIIPLFVFAFILLNLNKEASGLTSKITQFDDSIPSLIRIAYLLLVFVALILFGVSLKQGRLSFAAVIKRFDFFSYCSSIKKNLCVLVSDGVVPVLILALSLRVFFLYQPLKFDEAFTFLNYASKDWFEVFHYTTPGNHVLHSLLVKISTSLLGDSEIAIRLPAFVFGILNVLLVYRICLNEFGRKAALGAGLLMACCPFLILFDTMGRGYSLVNFLILLLMSILCRREAYRFQHILCLAIFMSAGMLTMTSFLMPAGGVILFFAKHQIASLGWVRGVKQTVILSMLAGVISFVCYTPVLLKTLSFSDIIDNHWVQSLSNDVFMASIFPHVQDVFVHMTRDVFAFIPYLMGGLILVLAFLSLVGKSQRIHSIVFYIVLSSITIFIAKKSIPFPRSWIFILPILFILTSSFLQCSFFKHRFLSKVTTGFIWGIALVSTFLTLSQKTVSKYENTGYFPEAATAVRFLYQRGAQPKMISTSWYPEPMVEYYKNRYHSLVNQHSGNSKSYYIKSKHTWQNEKPPKQQSKLILEYGVCEVYESIE